MVGEEPESGFSLKSKVYLPNYSWLNFDCVRVKTPIGYFLKMNTLATKLIYNHRFLSDVLCLMFLVSPHSFPDCRQACYMSV